MIFRESTQEDFDYMAEHSMNQKVARKMPDRVDYVFTLEHEGLPLGIGGFRMVTSTTVWCWIDLTEESKKHLAVAYRTIKEWMDIFAQKHDIVRLQAFARKDYPEAERLIKHLGFTREGLMEDFFGIGNDAWMYKKIRRPDGHER